MCLTNPGDLQLCAGTEHALTLCWRLAAPGRRGTLVLQAGGPLPNKKQPQKRGTYSRKIGDRARLAGHFTWRKGVQVVLR